MSEAVSIHKRVPQFAHLMRQHAGHRNTLTLASGEILDKVMVVGASRTHLTVEVEGGERLVHLADIGNIRPVLECSFRPDWSKLAQAGTVECPNCRAAA